MQKSYKLFNEITKNNDYVKEDDVMQSLYEGLYSLPTNLNDDQLEELKDNISRINNKVPLYDVYTQNLYLVDRNKTYNAVFKNFFRFPTNKLINHLLERQKYLKQYLRSNNDSLLARENRKITLIKKFMSNFNNNTLLKTYINVLYDVDFAGRNISLCRNPSFIPAFRHIRPYFTKKEQECIGLNNRIINESDNNLSDIQLRKICSFIGDYVLDANNIISHHNYIIKNNLTGIVQYYSMQGSYILNEYLRNESVDTSDYYDNIIKILSDAISNAPKFNKDIYVYRFIEEDYIGNIIIGGTYTNNSFMSCTRDPFYKIDTKNNTFGWKLLKIKIPKEFSALCIETVSQFPQEQEILLPPGTVLKLQSKNNKNVYYHPNKKVQDKIDTIYEFVIVDEPKEYKIKSNIKEDIPQFDFDIKHKMTKNNSYSNRDTIIHFIIDNTNSFNLFKCKIGKKDYIMIAEEYDSTSTYKPFYANHTDNGFCIYALDDKTHSLLFNLEIAEYIMYINYNVKYDNVKTLEKINMVDFIDFICRVSLYFNTQKVVYYCDYVYCNSIITNSVDTLTVNISSAYCYDVYNYLTNGKKKFSSIKGDFKPLPIFTYEMLDLLNNIKVKDLKTFTKKINNIRDNRIYYLYNDFRHANPDKIYCSDYLLWLINNKCGFVDDFVWCLSEIEDYQQVNPFINDYYIFYPINYMIDKGLIKSNPYVNIYSRENTLNNTNRFSGKNINRFIVTDDDVYRRKNKLKQDDNFVSMTYLYDN